MNYLRLGRATELVSKKDYLLYRLFEMIPGILAWATLGSVILFSFTKPVIMAVFIIVFDVYWLLKSLYLSIHLKVGFSQVQRNLKENWLQKVQDIDPAQYTLKGLKQWQDVYHIVMLPMYKESTEIVSSAIQSLVDANYPKDKMIVVLAQEERAGEDHNREVAQAIRETYSTMFHGLHIVVHPANIEGEMAGKGSNATYAMRKVHEEYILANNIPLEHILISVFDIDTIALPEYFGRLTYAYLTLPDPLRASYQPVPFYLNNVWDAPAFARIAGFSTTFWQTIKQEQFETIVTYSSHSMPYKALVDVGFWQTNMVSEDSRIFWQCLLHYDGAYRVEPLYYPVSMDSNLADTFWQTMLNIYKQHRRWGYGSENVPYFLFNSLQRKNMPLRIKLHYAFVMLEGIWSWATNALILFLLGWLPLVVGGATFNITVLSFNLPYFTRIITMLAMSGLVTSAMLSMQILPKRPAQYGKWKHVFMVFQWLMFPVNSILFGSIPALDAQTRLMLGKYMGFWVTPKTRSKNAVTSHGITERK
jgi:cellulose synthase/poly-beta-1,6-N-acetylglucosamine synthase-like glycosyltransferase